MVAPCFRRPVVAMRLSMAPSARARTTRSCPPKLPARAARLLAFHHRAEQKHNHRCTHPCARREHTTLHACAARARRAVGRGPGPCIRTPGGHAVSCARLLPPLPLQCVCAIGRGVGVVGCSIAGPGSGGMGGGGPTHAGRGYMLRYPTHAPRARLLALCHPTH